MADEDLGKAKQTADELSGMLKKKIILKEY